MAIRKKSETIHLRVDPLSKGLLEGLANISGKTATQIIEDLITEASEKTFLDEFDECVNTDAFQNEQVDLKSILVAVQHPTEPIITKLRMYFVASDFLSPRDRTVLRTILQHPQFFSGKTKIFKSVENLINKEFMHEVSDVDVNKIAERMDSLESFAVFKEKKPSWKSTYEMFLEMTGGEH